MVEADAVALWRGGLSSGGAARSGDEPLEVFALWNDGLSAHAEGTAPWMIWASRDVLERFHERVIWLHVVTDTSSFVRAWRHSRLFLSSLLFSEFRVAGRSVPSGRSSSCS